MKRFVLWLAVAIVACDHTSTGPAPATPANGAPWQVPLTATVRDVAWDQRRNVVYLSQPDSQRVVTLSLSTRAYTKAYTFLGEPRGIDLSLGDDTLFVAEHLRPYVTVLNLANGDRTSITNTTLFLNRGPDNVRAMANGKVLVMITFGGIGFGGSFVELDLATGTFGYIKDVTEYAPLGRSINRQSAIVLRCACSDGAAIESWVYSAARDTVVADRGTLNTGKFPVSADSTGAYYLVSGTLFDYALGYVKTIAPGYFAASVIAPDAKYAYLATSTGMIRVGLSDGTQQSTAFGAAPYLLSISPDGGTLVAATPTTLFVVYPH